MNAGFWFTVGLLTGATAAAATVPLWRRLAGMGGDRRRIYVLAGAGLAVFALSVTLLYLAIHSRATSSARTAASSPHSVGSDGAPGAKALTMQEATTQLEARLQKNGGSAEDWELLAKSYEFLGRPADATRARQHVATPTPATADATHDASMPSASDIASQAAMLSTNLPAAAGQSAPDVSGGTVPTAAAKPPADLERQLELHPTDKSVWLALAQWRRSQHDLAAARTAYEKLISLRGMTAQAWADYADVLGTLAGGSLRGDAGHAIDQALALEPTNLQALWLAATRALEEQRYADAQGLWSRLRGLLPPDSPDVRMVDANIAEARQLAAGSVAAAAEISGTVSIESQLASRVDQGATLFIYAKAADSPGPPLAVLRVAAGKWPVSFHLDDSMAMVPSRRLSQFQKVVVEARISRSGQASPAAGDLYVTSDTVNPGSRKKLALVINHEIG